jgi:hypothetical protein
MPFKFILDKVNKEGWDLYFTKFINIIETRVNELDDNDYKFLANN